MRAPKWLVVTAGVIAALAVVGTLAEEETTAPTGGHAKPHTTAPTTTSPAPISAPAGPELDQAGQFACEDFASGYPVATVSARMELARTVNEWAPQSDTLGIDSGAAALARTASASDSAWQLAADVFAQSCLDAGFGK